MSVCKGQSSIVLMRHVKGTCKEQKQWRCQDGVSVLHFAASIAEEISGPVPNHTASVRA